MSLKLILTSFVLAGEDRVLIKLNGKFLPHIQQLAENDTSK